MVLNNTPKTSIWLCYLVTFITSLANLEATRGFNIDHERKTKGSKLPY